MITRRCDVCKKAIKKGTVSVNLAVDGASKFSCHDICFKCVKLIPKFLKKLLQ